MKERIHENRKYAFMIIASMVSLILSAIALQYAYPGFSESIQKFFQDSQLLPKNLQFKLNGDDEIEGHIFQSRQLLQSQPDWPQAFALYCSKYGKSYQSNQEYQERLNLFKENAEAIQKHQQEIQQKISESNGELSEADFVQLQINEYADMTDEEWNGADMGKFFEQNGQESQDQDFEELETAITDEDQDVDDGEETHSITSHSTTHHPNVQFFFKKKKAVALPRSFDWRDKGVVTPVKRQGQCGSCWAFAAAAVLESAYAIASGNKGVELSEQQLLDCVNWRTWLFWFSDGCNGGFADEAFNFGKHHFITERKNYPYKGEKSKQCRLRGRNTIPIAEKNQTWVGKKLDQILQRSSSSRVSMKHFFKTNQTYKIRSRSVRALKEAILISPVAVAINTKHNDFKYYYSGVIDAKDCGTWTNHYVVAVGYGERKRFNSNEPEEFLIIKNTWGQWWGENGYARISLSQDHKKSGICGILTSNFLATVKQVEAPENLDENVKI